MYYNKNQESKLQYGTSDAQHHYVTMFGREKEPEREGNKELTFASHGYHSSFYMEKNLMTTCVVTKRS
jgi:hypothetical protein